MREVGGIFRLNQEREGGSGKGTKTKTKGKNIPGKKVPEKRKKVGSFKAFVERWWYSRAKRTRGRPCRRDGNRGGERSTGELFVRIIEPLGKKEWELKGKSSILGKNLPGKKRLKKDIAERTTTARVGVMDSEGRRRNDKRKYRKIRKTATSSSKIAVFQADDSRRKRESWPGIRGRKPSLEKRKAQKKKGKKRRYLEQRAS